MKIYILKYLISIKNNTTGCWSWIWLKKSYLHLRCITKVMVKLTLKILLYWNTLGGFLSQLANSCQFSQNTGDLKKIKHIFKKSFWWLKWASRSEGTRKGTTQLHKPHLPKESRLNKQQPNPKKTYWEQKGNVWHNSPN